MKEKRVVVITGASSGIGLATAELFANKGYVVYGISRSVVSDKDLRVSHLVGDVIDSDKIKSLLKSIFQKEGRIDIVICNAGMGISGASEFVDKSQTTKQININLLGAIETARHSVEYLKKTKGKILFTSSVAAIIPLPFQAAYSATKAGINLFAMSLRMELARFGIKVAVVMPGDTQTGFTAAREKTAQQDGYNKVVEKSVGKMEKDEKGGKTPESVARVFFRLANKKNPKPLTCVGISYKLIAVLAKILPQRTILWLVRKLYA